MLDLRKRLNKPKKKKPLLRIKQICEKCGHNQLVRKWSRKWNCAVCNRRHQKVKRESICDDVDPCESICDDVDYSASLWDVFDMETD